MILKKLYIHVMSNFFFPVLSMEGQTAKLHFLPLSYLFGGKKENKKNYFLRLEQIHPTFTFLLSCWLC